MTRMQKEHQKILRVYKGCILYIFKRLSIYRYISMDHDISYRYICHRVLVYDTLLLPCTSSWLLQRRGRVFAYRSSIWVRFLAGAGKLFSLYDNGPPPWTHPMTVLCINISLGLILLDSCTKKLRDEFQIGGSVCHMVYGK